MRTNQGVTNKIEVRLGQRVSVKPWLGGKVSPESIGRRTGKIVYIHPQNRFVVVDLGVFREAYDPRQIHTLD
ncbi:hypothetical protein CEB3_c18730 [Peptococcaceae bacterium CEB3]|nr:hypothetical protein CEB3_c18730 [Peptococcaceae bacterium CEB3]